MTSTNSPFHSGEHLAQSRAGVREQIEKKGRVIIRDFMPDQHRTFFAGLPFLVLATADRTGQPHASILFGPPGFVSSPSPNLLHVQACPAEGDPLQEGLGPQAVVGGLGIEPPTRRRNRVNGRIEQYQPASGFTLRVQQSFGNCPKYIQARAPRLGPHEQSPQRLRTEDRLTQADIEHITAADTFFIASRAAALDGSASDGLDVSHRGGFPGFVQVNSAQEICFPDYRGNLLFNTIGNLLADARCGLVFVDFKRGAMLHITGEARVVWDVPASEVARGIERQVVVTVARVIRREGASPLVFDFIDYSPHLKGLETTVTPGRSADI